MPKKEITVPLDLKQMLAQKVTEAGGRLTVKSALNPALWLCAIVSVPSLLISTYSSNPPWWASILALLPVGLACFGFIILLFIDRDKLQSEEFQIKKRTLELIEQKGMPEPMPIDALAVFVSPEMATTSKATLEGK
jgi:hypothetical protein